MDFVDILMFGKVIGGEGVQNPVLREICDKLRCPVDDKTPNSELGEHVRNALMCWEIDTSSGEDALGPYSVVSSASEVTGGDTLVGGVVRLKKGAYGIVAAAPSLGSYFGLDLSNAPEVLSATDIVQILNGKNQSASFTNTSPGRVILPETFPQAINSNTGQMHGTLPAISGACGKILLSKHFAVHTTNSNMFVMNSASKYTEEVVIAPKDMDAQFHLHRFTKMSADTIVAILENLADVNDRAESYTLTLGDTNLAKLTEEQKNIAIEKGWNLA